MKTHVLATAVLAALAWRAAVAASEGGDTWSAVERVQQSAYSVLQPAQQVEPATAMNASRDCSEGGDTWSNLQALHETTFGQAGTQDRTGPELPFLRQTIGDFVVVALFRHEDMAVQVRVRGRVERSHRDGNPVVPRGIPEQAGAAPGAEASANF